MPLLPPEAFPEGPLRTRAAKLPMWDQDREMAVMRIQSQREYLGRLRRTTQEAMDQGSAWVAGNQERVAVGDMFKRWTRLTNELAWEEALVVRNDLLLAAQA